MIKEQGEKSMKVYAMSDIHGYIQEFEEALLKIDLSGDNILILLGDYIHGPDSYGVMDKIIKLQEKYGTDKVIALLGNHDSWLKRLELKSILLALIITLNFSMATII